MSKIDELIKQLCPDGIQYEQLGENCEVLRGKRLTKKELHEDGNFPVFHGGLIPLGRYDKFNRSANQTMVINTGSVGEVVWSSVDFWSSDGTFVIKTSDTINDRFLYYFLKTQESYLKTQKREGGVPTIDRQTVENLSIPIPPLAIQEEIVNILDTFTTLEAELEAELEARKKQYTFYRDSLLSFEGKDVEWKKIKQVFRRIKGTSITATKMKEIQNDDGEIRVFAGGKTVVSAREIDIPNANITRVPSVLVQSRGVIDFVYFDKSFTFKNEMWAYTIDNKTTVKYLYYYLKNSTQYFRDAASGMGALPQISLPVTEDFVIPIPSISEQERIVEILDKFDVLVNDISTGLPAEIEARRKQYEYYRNQLLTFNNVSNE